MWYFEFKDKLSMWEKYRIRAVIYIWEKVKKSFVHLDIDNFLYSVEDKCSYWVGAYFHLKKLRIEIILIKECLPIWNVY